MCVSVREGYSASLPLRAGGEGLVMSICEYLWVSVSECGAKLACKEVKEAQRGASLLSQLTAPWIMQTKQKRNKTKTCSLLPPPTPLAWQDIYHTAGCLASDSNELIKVFSFMWGVHCSNYKGNVSLLFRIYRWQENILVVSYQLADLEKECYVCNSRWCMVWDRKRWARSYV